MLSGSRSPAGRAPVDPSIVLSIRHALAVTAARLRNALLSPRSLLALCAVATPLAAHSTPVSFVTVFTNVNVVPMDRDRTLIGQSVIVRDGRIAAIGRDLPLPPGATVIEGSGKWLSPGLADMHVHSESPDELAVYLVHGVTTVLTMGGARQRLVGKTAPRANRGDIPAPHVYTSFLVDGTPAYNGFVLENPAAARVLPALAKTQGYDFIKVYVGLAAPVFTALAEAAAAAKMPLVGHGVPAVRVDSQFAQGQAMIAHLEEFFYSYLFPPGGGEGENVPDEARIASAVAMAKRFDATITADPLTYRTIATLAGHPELGPAIFARPEFALLPFERRLEWRTSDYFTKTAKLLPRAEFLRKLVKAFADGGVRLILGTDAPTIPGLFPGASVHAQLAELRAAGLTPFQALATATAGPGEFIAKTKGGIPFGQIAAGMRADLLVTNANPFDDLKTLGTPVGVMTACRWRDRKALSAISAGVAARYRAAGTSVRNNSK